ncbi:MAG: cbb3-type cytochrome oxidase assembly protein CcoS [Bacteroidota bacterium]
MSVILILLVASISVAGIFLIAFLWGVRSGQFEDDYSPASRILFDDKPASSPEVTQDSFGESLRITKTQ